MGNRARITGIGFIAGLSIGIVLGAVSDNMGLWIGLGTALGIVFGAAIATVLTRRESEE